MKRFYLFAAALLVVAACEKENGKDNDKTTDPITEITYAGETYKVVTLADGSIWMAENLRYVPEGKEVSEDPAENAGIWYPYEVKDGAAVVLKDEASIKEYGYLYDIETVLGAKLTTDNFKSFEGSRGICPEGWHVPTRADWFSILGYAQKTDGMQEDEKDNTACFWNEDANGGEVFSMMEDAFALKVTGYRMRANILDATVGKYTVSPLTGENNCSDESMYGVPTMGYYWASTGYKSSIDSDGETLKNLQFFSAMVMFSTAYKNGRVTCGYNNMANGCPLRCVKD